MIREITKYPTTPSLEFGTDVRHFDETLLSLIQDLKDTMEAHNLKALAAFQIGSSLAVIVIKKDNGDFLELINPRVLKKEGNVTPIETTAYFGTLSAQTSRYEKIKLVYEDREAKPQFLEVDGDLSILIQRKMDYLYGSNFRMRLSPDEQKLFDAKLEFGTDAIMKNDCPTVFKRDRILQIFKYIFVTALATTFVKFFVSSQIIDTINLIENYTVGFLLLLIVVYFFYAQYEGKEYKQCTSCQIGNIIGTSVVMLVKVSVLFFVNFLI